MKRLHRNRIIGVLSLLLLAGAEKSSPKEFLRFVPDKFGGGTLQTAVTTYRDAKGRSVDLIAAVHVADPKYYAGLEKSFKSYDALLYEMVKPEGEPPPEKGGKNSGWVTMLQRFMKTALELQYQLDAIDYSAPNFVHADLDVDTFERMQAERGESIFGLMLKSMLDSLGAEDPVQAEASTGHLLMALQAPDRGKQLKLVVAKQFDDIERAMAGLDGPDGSVILTERNKKAIEVLDEQLKGGKKHLGIFYGAAHLPDMEQRVEAMGFKRVAKQWRVAWDMSGPPATRPATTQLIGAKP
jgi:hypothetical protein